MLLPHQPAKASSVSVCSNSFISSMIWSCNLSLALLCTLSLPSIAFWNISCLLLSICISRLMSWHLLPKSTEPFHCASHLAQLAIHDSTSRLPDDLLNGNTDLYRYPQSFFNSVIPTLTFSLLSRYLTIPLCQILESNTSPSPVFHQSPSALFFSG